MAPSDRAGRSRGAPGGATKILTVIGTRPEAIKMAPLLEALAACDGRIASRVCVTAQHRDLLDQMLEQFSIRPDHDLDVMTQGQSTAEIAARVMAGLSDVLRAESPSWVLVQGDTTSTMAAALRARRMGYRVGHVEAGLRSFDSRQPFPEELNRVRVSELADLHFAPSPVARANLMREGVDPASIFVTGNTGIDALYSAVERFGRPLGGEPWDHVPAGCRSILVTVHRRENLGRPLVDICRALRRIAERHLGRAVIFFPVHPRAEIRDTVYEQLTGMPNVHLSGALDYAQAVRLLLASSLVITDSGGLQEEAPALGKPVLVLREVTERPEVVELGVARLVGTEAARILGETTRLLDDEEAYRQMARRVEPYGDGRACRRIVEALLAQPPAAPAAGRRSSRPASGEAHQ